MTGYITGAPNLKQASDFAGAGASANSADATYGVGPAVGGMGTIVNELAQEVLDSRNPSTLAGAFASIPARITAGVQVFAGVPTNGTSDTYAAISAQWSAFLSNGGGTIMFPFIPAGIYMSQPLVLNANVPVTLLLNGNNFSCAATQYVFDINPGTVGYAAVGCSVLGPATIIQATVRTSNGIRVRNANLVHLKDIYFRGCDTALDVVNDGAGNYCESNLFDHLYAVGNNIGFSARRINTGDASMDQTWWQYCMSSNNYTHDFYQGPGIVFFRGGFSHCTAWIGTNNTTHQSVYINGDMNQGTYDFGLELLTGVTNATAYGFYVDSSAANINSGTINLRAVSDGPTWAAIAATASGYLTYNDGSGQMVATATGDTLWAGKTQSDSFPRLRLASDGTIQLGDGTADPSTQVAIYYSLNSSNHYVKTGGFFLSTGGLAATGNATITGTGTPSSSGNHKIPFYDGSGNLVGYIPIYATLT